MSSIILYFLFHLKVTGSGSRQLQEVDKVRDLGELCKIAAAVGVKTENLETIKEIQEKLQEHIEEKRQESRKASLVE